MDLIRRNGLALGVPILLIVAAWILILIVIPQLYMLDFSFRELDTETYSAGDTRSLQNYRYLITGDYGEGFDKINTLHLGVFVRTLSAAVLITFINILISYPLAYLLGQVVKGVFLRVLVVLLICPFWINEILRAFSFRLLFGTEGLLNDLLRGLGVVSEPIDFINLDIALYAGISYAYLLLMIMSIYNTVESLDHNQIEAAEDLAAPWWKIHWRIVIPHAKPGIASGSIMVFMLSAGTLATPQILGGTSSLWFTQVIERWMNASSNWPMGAAYSFALLISCIIFVLAVLKIAKVDLGAFAK